MNVLSVDFDWIMEPSIEAYNHISRGDALGPLRTWGKIYEVIPALNPECDLNKFNILYHLLLDKGKTLTKEDIFIGFNHDQIYNFLKDYNEKFNIVNIDHHHDMGYPQNGHDIEAFEQLSVANWVHYINKNKELLSYTWIHNKNSLHPREEEINNIKMYMHSTDIDLIENMKFDKIFLCASWEWVPPKYESLFDILVSTIDKR